MGTKVVVSIAHSSKNSSDVSAFKVLDNFCSGPYSVHAEARNLSAGVRAINGFGRVCLMMKVDGQETLEHHRIVLREDGTWKLEADLDIQAPA